MNQPEEDVLYACDDQVYPDYHLRVVRADVGGHLTVSFKGKAIYEQEVPLAYDARFGPDVMDIEEWGLLACKVTDEHRANHA